jgi:hypothetical protein
MGILSAEDAANFQQTVIADCDLHDNVAEGTRNSFDRIRKLHTYGILCYEAFTVANDLAWLLLEQALRERFIAFYGGAARFVNEKTGEERLLHMSDASDIDAAFRPGGTHVSVKWKLALSSGQTFAFRGSMAKLLEWARLEGLLAGQRNKRIEPIYVHMRNSVAHAHDHLTMPPDSARTIRDLAEIINRLWGHLSPGGRLYPSPLRREVRIIAWSKEDANREVTLMRDFHLPQALSRPWTCIVVRGAEEDSALMQFDAQYERTVFPAELLWGPGTVADAYAWLGEARPGEDSVTHLDRLFAVRIYDDRVSLARRPEVALALGPERRVGRWLVLRADSPGDAFVHGRHLKDRRDCGGNEMHTQQLENGVTITSPPLASCAVEEVFDGEWEEMSRFLVETLGIAPVDEVSSVRVPPHFDFESAPDVEDD